MKLMIGYIHGSSISKAQESNDARFMQTSMTQDGEEEKYFSN